jgi:16S rRNA (cytidine1402-2'-O)-methyltransferase
MSETIERGALYIVSTPIGNLSDITQRAVDILGGVDLIAAEDTRKTGFLLEHLCISKPLVSYFSYNERRRVPELISRLKAGASVAVVTDAGTPGISDPAYTVIREAVEQGIRVIPIPGASALLAALVASALPMDRFVFEGFLPVKKGRKTRLAELKEERRTILLYESPHRVEKTLEEILAGWGDRRVAVVREVTKKFEEVMRGTVSGVLAQIRQKAPRGEYVIVVAGTDDRRVPQQESSISDSNRQKL